jgi:hypothetical protein
VRPLLAGVCIIGIITGFESVVDVAGPRFFGEIFEAVASYADFDLGKSNIIFDKSEDSNREFTIKDADDQISFRDFWSPIWSWMNSGDAKRDNGLTGWNNRRNDFIKDGALIKGEFRQQSFGHVWIGEEKRFYVECLDGANVPSNISNDHNHVEAIGIKRRITAQIRQIADDQESSLALDEGVQLPLHNAGLSSDCIIGSVQDDCSHDRREEQEAGKSFSWISPPIEMPPPTPRILVFALGLLLSLTAFVFLFGPHESPEFGIPMFVVGLVLIVVSTLLAPVDYLSEKAAVYGVATPEIEIRQQEKALGHAK